MQVSKLLTARTIAGHAKELAKHNVLEATFRFQPKRIVKQSERLITARGQSDARNAGLRARAVTKQNCETPGWLLFPMDIRTAGE